MDGYGKEKGKGLAVMIGIGKGKPEKEEPEAETEEETDGAAMAADEAFDALKADDREAFKEAFTSAVEQIARRCMSEE